MAEKAKKSEVKSDVIEKSDGTMKLEIHGHEEEYPVKYKEFKTGSRGFFVSGKFNALDGKRYQIVLNIVEIGSKPKA